MHNDAGKKSGKIRKGTNEQQKRLKWPYKLKHVNKHPLDVF
jgi:hypothetical protein